MVRKNLEASLTVLKFLHNIGMSLADRQTDDHAQTDGLTRSILHVALWMIKADTRGAKLQCDDAVLDLEEETH